MKTVEQIIISLLSGLEKLWEKDALIITLILAVIVIEIATIFIKRSIK